MTQTEEVSMTFESKTLAEQMNGHAMAANGRRCQNQFSPSSTSPLNRGETSTGSEVAMGSEDSAGNTNGGPACGLVRTLFPSSCRGRAEAFARHLHRRLTSLGSENGSQENQTTTKPTENTWLHSSCTTNGSTTTNASNKLNLVLAHQPRHSPESDLFFDLDGGLEENGIGSPAEEATAAELAHLLVNPQTRKNNYHEACHCSPNGPRSPGIVLDSGSDGVYASPIAGNTPESDESEIYFDPLFFDGEKKKDIFFDPVTTSESEEVSTLSNGSQPEMMRLLRRKLENNKNEEMSKSQEETSESSCSMLNEELEIPRLRSDVIGSLDESSNALSSLDTTSRDSLWSTFDDSTLSESPIRIDLFNDSQIQVPKSHSASELPTPKSTVVIDEDYEKLSRRLESEEKKEHQGVDCVDFANSTLKETETMKHNLNDDLKTCFDNGLHDLIKENDKVEDSKSGFSELSDTEGDHSTYSSSINIPGDLTLECSSGSRIKEFPETVKNEVNLMINNETILSTSEEENTTDCLKRLDINSEIEQQDKHCRKVLEASAENNPEEEDEEAEVSRPHRVRRCSSLKTGKTPPGTPGRKKIVRFADVLGLDLADVRTFLDEIPKVPNSAYSDLIYDDVVFHKDPSPINCGVQSWSARYLDNNRGNSVLQKPDRVLVPLFQQPGGLPNFLDFVRDRRVCLENVIVCDLVNLCIKGTVRVCNLDFHKSVHIRYTLNSWKNYSDLQATYVPNSCDGFSDKFTFILYCHTLRIGQKLEFAVRFQVKGSQYWDNNLGVNYCFQCLPATPAVGYIPITAPENPHDWSPMFY